MCFVLIILEVMLESWTDADEILRPGSWQLLWPAGSESVGARSAPGGLSCAVPACVRLSESESEMIKKIKECED